jgi:hypothetical protein
MVVTSQAVIEGKNKNVHGAVPRFAQEIVCKSIIVVVLYEPSTIMCEGN